LLKFNDKLYKIIAYYKNKYQKHDIMFFKDSVYLFYSFKIKIKVSFKKLT